MRGINSARGHESDDRVTIHNDDNPICVWVINNYFIMKTPCQWV